ncbi:MAG: 3-carboxy-cis,cis-muconate cycloisomerase [Methylobacteriaceae bacterium]|nr:3-carboxy-cis,cis-muconate cycloisomerase [Methylobacteriaceae bacterium]
MTFSALDSELLGPLFATDAMRGVFSDRSRVAYKLQVEAALARAQARLGLAPRELAAAIEAISPDDLEIAALGKETAIAGVPTIPFIKAMRAKLPKELERAFHKGATTQDIVDTALVLQMRDGLQLIRDDLARTIKGLVRLARKHHGTVCVGRTYGQHAVPLTFGYKVAVWATGIAESAAELPALRARVLAVSLGGPVGTLATFGDKGPALLEAFAHELDLAAPPIAWHALRGRMAETGAWIATMIGTLAKMASDVVHLMSTEVGEVSEPHVPGRGGSSAMPHKRNPVGSTVITAAHAAAAGHVTTLLSAMAVSHERPPGLWHAEWHALPQLFGLASGALREAVAMAEGLTVDAARMRKNLDLTQGLLFSDAVASALAARHGRGQAHQLIEEAAGRVRDESKHLRDILLAEPKLKENAEAIEHAFDLAPFIDAAALWTERALENIEKLDI